MYFYSLKQKSALMCSLQTVYSNSFFFQDAFLFTIPKYVKHLPVELYDFGLDKNIFTNNSIRLIKCLKKIKAFSNMTEN